MRGVSSCANVHTLALWIAHCSVQSAAEYSNENSIDPSSGAANHTYSIRFTTTTASNKTMQQVTTMN